MQRALQFRVTDRVESLGGGALAAGGCEQWLGWWRGVGGCLVVGVGMAADVGGDFTGILENTIT